MSSKKMREKERKGYNQVDGAIVDGKFVIGQSAPVQIPETDISAAPTPEVLPRVVDFSSLDESSPAPYF